MTDIKAPSNQQFVNSISEQKTQSKVLVELIVEALLSKKARDVVVMDVSELTTLTEYFVICNGNSDVQVKALADAVEDDLLKKATEKPWKKEGITSRSWIILDYINIVVHVMSQEKREFYGIERMWNDAKITYIEDEKSSS